ncbi:hypothetical protein BDW60DRAFT_220361 [Aspergillus nidulans var. acristatus]
MPEAMPSTGVMKLAAGSITSHGPREANNRQARLSVSTNWKAPNQETELKNGSCQSTNDGEPSRNSHVCLRSASRAMYARHLCFIWGKRPLHQFRLSSTRPGANAAHNGGKPFDQPCLHHNPVSRSNVYTTGCQRVKLTPTPTLDSSWSLEP